MDNLLTTAATQFTIGAKHKKILWIQSPTRIVIRKKVDRYLMMRYMMINKKVEI